MDFGQQSIDLVRLLGCPAADAPVGRKLNAIGAPAQERADDHAEDECGGDHVRHPLAHGQSLSSWTAVLALLLAGRKPPE